MFLFDEVLSLGSFLFVALVFHLWFFIRFNLTNLVEIIRIEMGFLLEIGTFHFLITPCAGIFVRFKG